MEEIFTKIVDQIFNNWTALRLAVEHSLGGPNSMQLARDSKNYMVQYCLYESNVEEEDIQDALDDIMDEEFQTICEDNSTKEIAVILFKFLKLLKENNLEQCEVEFNNLPKANAEWLTMSKCTQVEVPVEHSDDSEGTSQETPMEEDSEWTTVKTRRKR
ncbi:hypothetical protein HHI36_020513 [Cryptolaemus montrouzieri]|uniref:Pre-rRNA-processing protein TSR2 homolog n=1 Tax=Cryptolaemus montrouzieri TaxID=559131 RepID=A0ABD2NAX5_9CUCU